jgi:hypothetical protein
VYQVEDDHDLTTEEERQLEELDEVNHANFNQNPNPTALNAWSDDISQRMWDGYNAYIENVDDI